MPKYFFHIRSPDTFLVDDLGIELRDLDHVWSEARQGARDIMAEDLQAGRTVDHQQFEVLNEAGDLVLTLPFRNVLMLPDSTSKSEVT